jgi:Fe-S cluster assembly scaffold protein SufB
VTIARPRPARRALDELSLPVEAATLDRLTASEPAWLRADREAAFAAWAALPGESNQLYTPYIDLRAAELADVAIDTTPSGLTAPPERPDDADGLITMGRDGVAIVLSDAARAAGVELTTAADLLARDPVRLQALLVTGALPTDDKFAQLTHAFWSEAAILDIPSGVRLERPIVVRWEVGTPGRALLTRTIVRLGDGAEASVVEELVGPDEPSPAGSQAFVSGTAEVVLGDRSKLRLASLQELPEHVVAMQHRWASIGTDASLVWALAQLGGRLVRSRVDNVLAGDRSTVEQVEIVFGAGDQLFDLTSYTRHVGRDTTGNLLSKGVLLDSARTYLKGMITIDKTAIGTDSFLGEFGMNLSKKARSVAIPSLEIDQPDCRRAAHSSSVGPIDETQLFYLESRGIPPDEARKFIVLGFLEPVVARVPLEGQRDRLRDLLEAKWYAGTEGAAAA